MPQPGKGCFPCNIFLFRPFHRWFAVVRSGTVSRRSPPGRPIGTCACCRRHAEDKHTGDACQGKSGMVKPHGLLCPGYPEKGSVLGKFDLVTGKRSVCITCIGINSAHQCMCLTKSVTNEESGDIKRTVANMVDNHHLLVALP